LSVLLDSSAWLAHLFGESGVEEINLLFDDADNEIYISALSIPEVQGRLKALGAEAHWAEVWERYTHLFGKILPTNEVVAHEAVKLRTITPQRLPTIDALIAATAVAHQLTLVHRDPHFAAIPSQLLRQQQLPNK
jgi:predicted nucleic acid-binding protein